MAFYKLFRVLHRRTDYDNMMHLIDRMLNPEYYQILKRKSDQSIMNILALSHFIQSRTNSSFSGAMEGIKDFNF